MVEGRTTSRPGWARRAAVVALAVLGVVPTVVAGTAGADTPGSGRAALNASRAPCPLRTTSSFLIRGRVRACGTSLVDGAGHRVRLLSYEVLSMYPGEGDVAPVECGHWQAPPADLAGSLRGWGMNSAQILISWANLEPTAPTRLPDGRIVHHWDLAYLTALDLAIQQFRDAGVAVVLSLGQSRWSPAFRDLQLPSGRIQACGIGMPMWLYPRGGGLASMVRAERRFFADTDGIQARFRAVWRMLARRYHDNPALVGVEMLFEAYDLVAVPFLGERASPSSLDLAGFYQRVGRAIHSVTPGLLVIYSDWQSYPSSRLFFAIERKPDLLNAVYSYELYGGTWNATLQGRFDRYEDRAAGWNVPAWIAEFDAFGYGRRENPEIQVAPHWQQDTLALLTAARSRRTGWSLVGPVDEALAAVMRQGH